MQSLTQFFSFIPFHFLVTSAINSNELTLSTAGLCTCWSLFVKYISLPFNLPTPPHPSVLNSGITSSVKASLPCALPCLCHLPLLLCAPMVPCPSRSQSLKTVFQSSVHNPTPTAPQPIGYRHYGSNHVFLVHGASFCISISHPSTASDSVTCNKKHSVTYVVNVTVLNVY